MPKISAGGASGGGQLAIPANAFVREDGVVTAPPAGSGALLASNNLLDVSSQQAALNTLAGAVTSGDFLRGNGTNVAMSAILAADLPTGTTSAKGALQLDGTAGDIQPAQQSAAAGSNGKPADSGHAHPPGSAFLCTPSQYAPVTPATLTVNTTSLAAFSSANVNTGSFTAPASGSVIVTASFYPITGNTADEMGVALASHGTTTVVGNAGVMQFSSAGFCAPATIPFLVTGLTPGTSYNFDLMGNATSGGSWSVLAVGTQAPVLTSGGRGGPVVMTVQAV